MFLGLLSLSLSGAKAANAQWANYGSNIANTNAGYVGIGTSLPTALLEVVGSTTNSSLKAGGFEIGSYSVDNNWASNNIYYNSGFKYRGNGYGDQMYFYNGDIRFLTAGSNSGGAGVAANLTPQLVIKNNGYIGIGTTSPSYKLHVVGDSYVSGNSTVGGNATVGGSATIGSATVNNILTLKTYPTWSDNNKVLMIGSSGMVGVVDTTNWDKNANDDVTTLVNTYGLSIGTSGTIRMIGLNPAAVTSTTWGNGSAFTWTFNSGASEPGLTFDNGTVSVNNASLNVNGAVKMNSGTRPACTGSMRGTMWYTAGIGGTGIGTKDTFSVCAQDDWGTADWRTLY